MGCSETILTGRGSEMTEMPRTTWECQLAAAPESMAKRLAFMSEDHHRVRDFAVLELARAGAPLAPETIAEALDLAVPRVVSILEELEAHLTFVFRGDRRVVTWAYPVTVDETPHHASFSTGEEAYSP